jgi:2-dehydro-3-deoxygluconokinase
MKRFVSVGECIVELISESDRSYRSRIVGQSIDMALDLRKILDANWAVDYVTALGDDHYSQGIVGRLVAGGVGIGHIAKVTGRNVGLSVVEATDDGSVVTNWRGQSAARLMADYPEALAAAFTDADTIYVTGAAFAILSPRARGRLLKALHRAREAGTRIVLAPLEWPDMWTSQRVAGSAINVVATVADIVLTVRPGERAIFGDASSEAIAARYHDWGVAEVVIRTYRDGTFLSTPSDGRWYAHVAGSEMDKADAQYLAARAQSASPEDAMAAVSRSSD